MKQATKSRAVAEGHRLLDVGIELQLVLDVFRREQRAVAQPADVLGAVDDLQMPVWSKKPASPVCTQPSAVFVSAVVSGFL